MQLPLFAASALLTSINLHYVTPVSEYPHLLTILTQCSQGKSKSTREVFKRIDYGGSLTLLGAVRTFFSLAFRFQPRDSLGLFVLGLLELSLQRRIPSAYTQCQAMWAQWILTLANSGHLLRYIYP